MAIDNLISYEEFVRDLKGLLSEKLSCHDFREKYLLKNASVDINGLPDLVGSLSHYIDDEDLRIKDSAYKKMQNHELLKLIGLLEKRAPIDILKEIHFLGLSK